MFLKRNLYDLDFLNFKYLNQTKRNFFHHVENIFFYFFLFFCNIEIFLSKITHNITLFKIIFWWFIYQIIRLWISIYFQVKYKWKMKLKLDVNSKILSNLCVWSSLFWEFILQTFFRNLTFFQSKGKYKILPVRMEVDLSLVT